MSAWGARALAAAVLGAVAFAAPAAFAQTSDLVSKTHLRVCADPANLPFSSKDGSGFENKIAELMAEKMGKPIQYTWFPQALGFVRRTLAANQCDVIIGFAQGHELVLNTNHYYTSAYVLVVAPDSPLGAVDRLSDPALQGMKVGVTAGAPPATHLARHGHAGTMQGYALMVDRRVDWPAKRMIDDLKAGELDAAILWGPIGGNLARDAGLKVTPLLNEEGTPRLFYRITMGVRQGERAWKRDINSFIRRNQAEIDAILTEFGVPLITDMGDGLK